jgi:hypothetical protein
MQLLCTVNLIFAHIPCNRRTNLYFSPTSCIVKTLYSFYYSMVCLSTCFEPSLGIFREIVKVKGFSFWCGHILKSSVSRKFIIIFIIITIINAIQFSLSGSRPYTSTDKTNNIHKQNNTKNSTNNTKHSKYKYTYYQNTHT